MSTPTPDTARAFADLAGLVALGPREAGGPAEAAGAARLVEGLQAAGLEAGLRPFATALWHERAARLEVPEGAGWRDIAMASVPFGGVTGGAAELPLAFADGFGVEDSPGEGLRGKAWLVPRDAYRDYPDRALVEAAAPWQPAAFLFTAAPGHRGGVPTVYYNFRDRAEAPPPPMATIAFDDAVALAQGGTERIRLTIDADVLPAQSANVVGVLPGRSLPDEIVVVCAHVDSARGSPGACDNAGGAAAVMELARMAAAAGGFARTVHFCVWGSHETGMHGSEAYIAEAPARGERVKPPFPASVALPMQARAGLLVLTAPVALPAMLALVPVRGGGLMRRALRLGYLAAVGGGRVRGDDAARRICRPEVQALAGGQQQRVTPALALASEPALLLLDEPLSALDRKLREGSQARLRRIRREPDVMTVLVTHDQDEALALSARIAVMRDGRIEAPAGPRRYAAARPRTSWRGSCGRRACWRGCRRPDRRPDRRAGRRADACWRWCAPSMSR